MEWEAEYYGLEELLRIIDERKGKKDEKKRPKMSSRDFEEKALEMRKSIRRDWARLTWQDVSAQERMASEYDEIAADLRRLGY